MKLKTLYVCEICNTNYKTMEMAENCEQGHKSVEKIQPFYKGINQQDNYSCPYKVGITFNDGTYREYKS